MQDKGTVTRPGLLYYIKGVFTAVLSNIHTPISLMNRDKYTSVGIVLDDDSMFNLRLVNNQANNYSNLLLNRCKYNLVQSFSKSYISISIHSFQTCLSRA